MGACSFIDSPADFRGSFPENPSFVSGFPVGIIAITLNYAKLPGNVVNPASFDFPVLYEEVTFDIEDLFRGADELREQVVAAAVKLESRGVKAIAGACGYFLHFQEDVRNAVNVPVFLSSLLQLPLLLAALPRRKKVAVFAASGSDLTPDFLARAGAGPERVEVIDVGAIESFAPIRYERGNLDNGRLADDLAAIASGLGKRADIGAILLECSDLPPYAKIIQRASGLPVADFISLIDYAHRIVSQPFYRGRVL